MARKKRTGLYIRDLPLDEIREVSEAVGISPEAVIGILLRQFDGRVAEAVLDSVTQRLLDFGAIADKKGTT